MQEGDAVTGTVRSLMSYGAFIDLGGVDGLLHVSDMAWGRVNKPEDVLSAGPGDPGSHSQDRSGDEEDFARTEATGAGAVGEGAGEVSRSGSGSPAR